MYIHSSDTAAARSSPSILNSQSLHPRPKWADSTTVDDTREILVTTKYGMRGNEGSAVALHVTRVGIIGYPSCMFGTFSGEEKTSSSWVKGAKVIRNYMFCDVVFITK